MHTPKRELVPCHDCGRAVSFSAVACPHCGSREPGGPYVFSPREKRRHNIEARNDHTLITTILACAIVGAVYGLLVPGTLMAAVGFCLLGGIIGAPVGAAIIFTSWVIGE
jgi:DNA-directed RNA polymerase subunit RPC12/RpoP